METAGRFLILAGLVALLLGGALLLLGRLLPGRGLGDLPGNLVLQTGNFTCVIGLGVSIFLSILLTVVLNLVLRFMDR